jgi:hypothetical protein
MSKTIKQLAEEFGVSKTAIRKRFSDDFKANYVETLDDGSLQVSAEGCKLIAESLRKPQQTAQTSEVETAANQSLRVSPDIQQETMGILTGQLAAKDEQIRAQQQQLITKDEQIKMMQAQLSAKDEQITQLTAALQQQTSALESTTAALTAAQALHAADKRSLMLLEDKESERKLSFWERRAAKKAAKKARKEQAAE